ncbi:MAG: HAMP domain-containing histidine kinase, partial [Candidatus Aminicenantes bacterium]|nr:HAMP domain-containing histidine kinase [Candidatus Aminicenantes bacterium]
DGLLARSGAEVVHPLPFQSPSLEGFVLLGPKRSGQKFSRDDLDFLMTLSGELAPNLERLRLQEEVIYERASREKADELNRLKTDFVSAVSHELRTPMSAIRGATDLLRDGLARDRAKREELLGVLASESGRLSRLIDNILDFGKIERAAKTYRFAPVDARLLVGEAVRVLAPRADEAGFKLELSIPPEEAMISADRDAVVQALVNLVDNALKYSTETKEVEVEVRTGPAEVEVLVRDRGIGLQPEDGEKIFEPFYRAPEAVLVNPKGVGIGLKIVRHIMDAHHGRVTVESRPGGGSEFNLIFPKDGGR